MAVGSLTSPACAERHRETAADFPKLTECHCFARQVKPGPAPDAEKADAKVVVL